MPPTPPAVAGPSPPAWAVPAEALLAAHGSSPSGLSPTEAARRLRRYGPNALADPPRTSAWRVLRDQFASTVVALLVVAAVVALAFGEIVESLAIAAVLVVNAAIGFWTEWRARVAMDALQRLDAPRASVLRDGEPLDVRAREIVPGDVLVLEPGDVITADARVLSAAELQVNEAPLTGESVPVLKSPDAVGAETLLADRSCMLHKGTPVSSGSGRALVIATGMATEIGRIGALVAGTPQEDAPLEVRLERLGRRLVWLVLGIGVVVAVSGLLRGVDTWLMIETALALAVAAVPEGLPAVATITLAAGMRRMARRRALVRRLAAVETLGSTTVVCTDKTGTLTGGEMTLRALWVAGRTYEVTGEGYDPRGRFRVDDHDATERDLSAAAPALRVGVLANRAGVVEEHGEWRVSGDPTEAALLVGGRKAGLERAELVAELPEVAELPFSSARMLMATFHKPSGGEVVACLKGAPEKVLERCSRWHSPAGEAALDEAARATIDAANRDLASSGLRVLGLACGPIESGAEPGDDALHDLTFEGLVGELDPPARGVPETIAVLRAAAVRVVMLTGDQRLTGEAVARELGLVREGDVSLDGAELAAMDDEELARVAPRLGAVSRVTPEQKLRVIDAFRARGEIVAMLGDGVNDAPALKRAHIGVAMGRRGTDVARETADLVLQDDRLETVAAAVEEGRVIFDNIRKFVFYLFSCNLAEVLLVGGATVAGLPLPLLPLHLLWLNMLTDVFPALALALEPGEPDVMRRPPRDPRSAILSRRFLGSVAVHGIVLTAAAALAFAWALRLPDATLEHARTVAFMALAMAQVTHVLNARSDSAIVLSRRLFLNPHVWGAVLLTLVLQLAAVYLPPLAALLETSPLSLADWGAVAVAAALPLLVGQAWRLAVAGRGGEGAPSSAECTDKKLYKIE